jgi:hypothetical protein
MLFLFLKVSLICIIIIYLHLNLEYNIFLKITPNKITNSYLVDKFYFE